MRKYYKVVTHDLQSAFVTNPIIKTQYKLGEFVSSPFPETPLAVFTILENALAFKNVYCGPSYKIFECEIKNRTKIPWLPGNSLMISIPYISKIVTSIKKKKKYINLVCRNLPSATITCKQVKLIKEITDENDD